MPIYASVWTGAGTEASPRRPLAVTPGENWRGVASLPDLCFINYSPGPAPQLLPVDPQAGPTGVLLLAPNLDTPIGAANAKALAQQPFKFPAVATETPRDIAHRIGVWFTGEVRV